MALVLLIAFVLDNAETVRVGFVFFNAKVSLIWVLLIAALLGALVDRLVILLGQRRRRAAPAESVRTGRLVPRLPEQTARRAVE